MQTFTSADGSTRCVRCHLHPDLCSCKEALDFTIVMKQAEITRKLKKERWGTDNYEKNMGIKRRPHQRPLTAATVETLDDLRTWLEKNNLILLVDHFYPTDKYDGGYHVELHRYLNNVGGGATTLEADTTHPDFVQGLIEAMDLYEEDHDEDSDNN